jgi:hypothetical protein
MKTANILTFLLLSSPFLYAQRSAESDTIRLNKGNADKQLEHIKERKTKLHSDSTGNEPLKSALIDTTVQNKYGDLLDDDPEYNKKYPLWIPAVEVPGALVVTWSIDRFILNADYSRIGITTWKYNLQKGWEWDNDRFGINFIGHPYSGTLSYNAGRSNGYGFFPSFLFSVAGSLMWEYFGENTRPSYNDIIYTPTNGVFLGEILYRLSSNILDDRRTGADRVFREISAGLLDPIRGFNRLLQGKSFRTTNKEVYEKEPLNISFYTGMHMINNESQSGLGKGTNSMMINAQFDYGNPFEIRSRKPFDFFKLRADFDIGVGRKYLANLTGYGILLGKNTQMGTMPILAGGFQYYDYWDNKTFELGSIGFGGGTFSKLPISKTIELYTNVHLAFMPFGGNSTQVGPDTSQVRDYNFGGGFEGKLESTLNLGKYATASVIYNYFMIRTYVGPPGDNFIGILKPRITAQLYKDLSIGFEHYVYYNDRYLHDFPAIHSVRTEQKVFLQLFLEDSQRRGHYN